MALSLFFPCQTSPLGRVSLEPALTAAAPPLLAYGSGSSGGSVETPTCSLAARFLPQNSSKCKKFCRISAGDSGGTMSCSCSDSLPTPQSCRFCTQKCFRGERSLSLHLRALPSPDRPRRWGVCGGNVVLNYKIRNVHVERFSKIKLYTNWSLLNYPTNIPQTRQQKNQSPPQSLQIQNVKSSSNYRNGEQKFGK